MAEMLASDLNNPEFVNPMDPDQLLHSEFYWYEPIDKWESDRQSAEKGRKIEVRLPRQVFVRIMKPGDQTSILEVPAREDHKRRWPQKWLYFQMQEGLIDDGKDFPGWKIEEWDEINGNPEFVRGLKFMRFHTVEQIAGASDAQVQGIGLGGYGLREKAKLALRNHMSEGVKSEIEARDKIIAEQGEALKKLQEQMATFMQAKTDPAPVEAQPESVKKRKGWPKGKPRKPKVE